MSSTSEPVSIRLLDREYTVGVEPGERDRILGLRGVQQGFSLLLELLEIRALG